MLKNIEDSVTKCMTEDLYAIGICFERGLSCCSDNIEVYQEILNIAVEIYEEKASKLKQHFEAKEFAKYMIEIHGLKSSFRFIGADNLGDFAEAQENSVKQSNTEYILETYQEMMKDYFSLVSNIFILLEKYNWFKREIIIPDTCIL